MALNVISNFAANVAHRNLVSSDMNATSSLSKLSSGLRVVSAKDDAASLAIGSRLRAEVAAMETASQNASQAASLLQIADGALATIGDILVRMKALAVQASSGQFGTTERAVLDSEYQALNSEITRIAQDTEFNGTQLINGGAAVFDANGDSTTGDQTLVGTTAEFTAGSAPGFSLSYDTTNTTLSGASFRLSYDNSNEELSLTNINTGVKQVIDITTAFNTQLTADNLSTGTASLASGSTIDVNFSNLGVTVTVDSNFVRTDATLNTEASQSATLTAGTVAITVTTHTVDFATSGVAIADLQELVGVTGYTVADGLLTLATTADNGTTGTITLNAVTGLQYSVNGAALTADNTASDAIQNGTSGNVRVYAAGTDSLLLTINYNNIDQGTGNGALAIDVGELLFGTSFTAGTTSQSFSFKVGTGAATQDSLVFSVSAATASVLGVSGTVITDATSANAASTAVSSAIDTINQQRATVGAAQNRLNFAASNLATSIENAEAARSGLLDLDVAQEIATFTSRNILVQTGISMLAQANQVPQNLLRLFQ